MSADRMLREGLLDAAAFELMVGTLDGAARDDATTCAAGERCGPPDAGVAPDVDAPEVDCRLTRLDAAATAAAWVEVDTVVACSAADDVVGRLLLVALLRATCELLGCAFGDG